MKVLSIIFAFILISKSAQEILTRGLSEKEEAKAILKLEKMFANYKKLNRISFEPQPELSLESLLFNKPSDRKLPPATIDIKTETPPKTPEKVDEDDEDEEAPQKDQDDKDKTDIKESKELDSLKGKQTPPDGIEETNSQKEGIVNPEATTDKEEDDKTV